MSDRLRKFFSSSKPAPAPVPEEPGIAAETEAPQVELPFRGRRYEEAVQGAHPAQGFLPLRGNKAFALRHDPPENSSWTESSRSVGGGSSSTISDRGLQSASTSNRHSTDGYFARGTTGQYATGSPSQRHRHTSSDTTVPISPGSPGIDYPYGGRPIAPRTYDPKQYWKGGVNRRSYPDQFDGDSGEMGIQEQNAGTNIARAPIQRKPVSSQPGGSALRSPSSSSQVKTVRFTESRGMANNDMTNVDTQAQQYRTTTAEPLASPMSQTSDYSWTTADENEASSEELSNSNGRPSHAAYDTATLPQLPKKPRAAVSGSERLRTEPQEARTLVEHLPGKSEPLLSVSQNALRDSSSTALSDRSAKRDVSSASSIEPPPRVSSKGKAIAGQDGADSPASVGAEEVVRCAGYDSVNTTVHETVRPAVTHETVHTKVHHIREERISREIHTHDIYHRVLPIVDVQVLPPRHFKVEDDKLVEMKESEIPPGRNWVIAETVSTGKVPTEPRRFTAREFRGEEGDERTYITPEGFPRTETTWVHPPQLEPGGQESGQTVPVIF